MEYNKLALEVVDIAFVVYIDPILVSHDVGPVTVHMYMCHNRTRLVRMLPQQSELRTHAGFSHGKPKRTVRSTL